VFNYQRHHCLCFSNRMPIHTTASETHVGERTYRMVHKVALVAIDPSINGEEKLRVMDKVKVQQVSHSIGIIHPTTPLGLLVSYHLHD